MTRPTSSEHLPTERRPARRNRVLLAGIISYADGKHNFDCAIHDVTDMGARVRVRGQQFPSDFYLINIRDRLAYDAKVVWNSGKDVGVSFKTTFRLADIVDPTLSYLANLWFARASR